MNEMVSQNNPLQRKPLGLLTILLFLARPLASAAQYESGNSAPTRELKAKLFERLPLDNVLFHEDVLREVPSRSGVECSKQCLDVQSCAMGTFYYPWSDGATVPRCRIFSKVHSAGETPRDSSLGAYSFGPAAPCGDGYQLQCGRCLRVESDKVIYDKAQSRCPQLSAGRLAMPKTMEDLACVQAFADDNGIETPWLGARDDKGKTAVYQWNDGTPLPRNSSLWHTSAMDSEGESGNNCVFLTQNACSLYPGNCFSGTNSFICEADSK